MTHAELIARATAEAERQGFVLVAIHAVPAMGAAITLCLAPGYHPWAVHRFSLYARNGVVLDALNNGGYHASRERALAEFSERLDDLLTAAAFDVDGHREWA